MFILQQIQQFSLNTPAESQSTDEWTSAACLDFYKKYIY